MFSSVKLLYQGTDSYVLIMRIVKINNLLWYYYDFILTQTLFSPPVVLQNISDHIYMIHRLIFVYIDSSGS